ncbi:MAG: AraC family transcriptional regulator, partial [Gammaproteobacteria bacterium]|nr:AraC family transcriptional regulator [Gammaproteobacteria bacterium]
LNIARRDRGYFERSSLECARLICDDMACAFERLASMSGLGQDFSGVDDDGGDTAKGSSSAARGLHRGSRPEPAYIRLAEAYIRAHCTEPLTIERVATASGISQRTLLEGFRCHRGTSPKAMLRDLRFQRARQALLAAAPGSATVADIATASGFYELGRFAVEYRRRYAEAPSATLRRTAAAAADAGATAKPEIYELFDGVVRQAPLAFPAFRPSPALDS